MYKFFCAKCSEPLMIYQKDGGGVLVRCYFDRIHYPDIDRDQQKLACQKCNQLIGTRMIYKKENRTAFSMIKHSYYFEKA